MHRLMQTPAAPPDIRRLDFSRFHPQDHRAFARRCRSLPGGGPRHLRDWWDYRFEHHPHIIIGRLACKALQRHEYAESWHAHKATPAQRAGLERRPMYSDGASCLWCYRRAPGPDGEPEPCPEYEHQSIAQLAMAPKGVEHS